MTLRTCKTCRFWEKLPWPDDLWGRCVRTVGINGASEDGETLAWVELDGKGSAWLDTYETFGCVQHEDVAPDPEGGVEEQEEKRGVR